MGQHDGPMTGRYVGRRFRRPTMLARVSRAYTPAAVCDVSMASSNDVHSSEHRLKLILHELVKSLYYVTIPQLTVFVNSALICNSQLSSRIVKFSLFFLNYCTCLLCYLATCLVNKDVYI